MNHETLSVGGEGAPSGDRVAAGLRIARVRRKLNQFDEAEQSYDAARELAMASGDAQSELLMGKQSVEWDELKRQRKLFELLPAKLFALRESKDWNQATYQLETLAAPPAAVPTTPAPPALIVAGPAPQRVAPAAAAISKLVWSETR